MKHHAKKLVLVVVAVAALFLLTGCVNDSGQIVSGNRIIRGRDIQRFDTAYVILGDKTIVEGKIEQWRDFDNSDVIQVMIDGHYYLTHYSNVVMVADAHTGPNSTYGFEVD